MTTRRRTTRERADGPPNVRMFPPLPRVPPGPRFPPDVRQSRAARIIGEIARATSPSMHVSAANLSKGFPASAVDLGRLQDTLERGLARFDAAQTESRWSEIVGWISSVIGRWVQRPKRVKIERREKGIRVELTTQDDLGYYDYAFDVFPRR